MYMYMYACTQVVPLLPGTSCMSTPRDVSDQASPGIISFVNAHLDYGTGEDLGTRLLFTTQYVHLPHSTTTLEKGRF